MPTSTSVNSLSIPSFELPGVSQLAGSALDILQDSAEKIFDFVGNNRREFLLALILTSVAYPSSLEANSAAMGPAKVHGNLGVGAGQIGGAAVGGAVINGAMESEKAAKYKEDLDELTSLIARANAACQSVATEVSVENCRNCLSLVNQAIAKIYDMLGNSYGANETFLHTQLEGLLNQRDSIKSLCE